MAVLGLDYLSETSLPSMAVSTRRPGSAARSSLSSASPTKALCAAPGPCSSSRPPSRRGTSRSPVHTL